MTDKIFYLNIKNNEVHTYNCLKHKFCQYTIIYEKDIYEYNLNCSCVYFYKNLYEIKKYCKIYQLTYNIFNDIVSIKTKLSDWKIIVPAYKNQKIKLLHSNMFYYNITKYYNNNKQDYHIQFIKDIPIKELIQYIALHDKRKWAIQ